MSGDDNKKELFDVEKGVAKEKLVSDDEMNELMADDELNLDMGQYGPDLGFVDFSNKEKIEKSQFPVLERIDERLSKGVEQRIYDLISEDATITFDRLAIRQFDEYRIGLQSPTIIHYLRYHPLRGKMLFIVSNELMDILVDAYYGGSGMMSGRANERDYTQAELLVIEKFVKNLFKDIEDAWAPTKRLKVEHVGHEINPMLVNITAADEMVLVRYFNVKIDQQAGQIQMVLPYSMVEPIKELLDFEAARSDDEFDPNWIKSLRAELLDVEFEVSSVLTETNITLGKAKSLQDGDIIPVEMPEEVPLYIEDQLYAIGKFGNANDKYSIEVLEIEKNEES